MPSLDPNPVLDALVSHALASGYFERVNSHEPKNAPGNGLSVAVWADWIGPATAASGLATTSVLMRFNVRVFSNMIQEPQDAIDPTLLTAVGALMEAYTGDFTLGGLVREVDLLGQYGPGLSGQAGYLNQDGKLYRVMTITVPLVLDDVWSQQP